MTLKGRFFITRISAKKHFLSNDQFSKTTFAKKVSNFQPIELLGQTIFFRPEELFDQMTRHLNNFKLDELRLTACSVKCLRPSNLWPNGYLPNNSSPFKCFNTKLFGFECEICRIFHSKFILLFMESFLKFERKFSRESVVFSREILWSFTLTSTSSGATSFFKILFRSYLD